MTKNFWIHAFFLSIVCFIILVATQINVVSYKKHVGHVTIKPKTILVHKEKAQQIKTQVFEVTAYTAGYESTGKHSTHPEFGITASGKKVQEGTTVACPPSIPFETEIFIVELRKVFVCQDRGSAITEGHLDIYMKSIDAAQEFGRRKMDVLVKL